MELWKPITNPTVKTGYEVSDWGRVRYQQHCLSPSLSSGYLVVNLQTREERCDSREERLKDKTKRKKYRSLGIHRLVAEAFLNTPPDMVVKHIDGNNYNNRLTNLEVLTRSERIRQYKWTPYSRPINRYDYDGNLLASYRSIQEAARSLSLTPSSISVALQRGKPHGGYYWQYISRVSQPEGKVHPDFPGYLVTRCGRVYSQKTNIWRKPTRSNGRDSYLLTTNGKRRTIGINRLLHDLYGKKEEKKEENGEEGREVPIQSQ